MQSHAKNILADIKKIMGKIIIFSWQEFPYETCTLWIQLYGLLLNAEWLIENDIHVH